MSSFSTQGQDPIGVGHNSIGADGGSDMLNGNLSLDGIYSSLSPLYEKATSKMQDLMGSLLEDGLSPGKLMYMQAAVFGLTTSIQLITTVAKELSDSMKGIIQKIG